jgi:hypothetical protein
MRESNDSPSLALFDVALSRGDASLWPVISEAPSPESDQNTDLSRRDGRKIDCCDPFRIKMCATSKLTWDILQAGNKVSKSLP